MHTLYAFAFPPEAPTLRLFALQIPGDEAPTFFAMTEEDPVFGSRTQVGLALSAWEDPYIYLKTLTETLAGHWKRLPPGEAPRPHWLNNFFLAREKNLPPAQRPSLNGQWFRAEVTEPHLLLAMGTARRASARPLRYRLMGATALGTAAILAMIFLY